MDGSFSIFDILDEAEPEAAAAPAPPILDEHEYAAYKMGLLPRRHNFLHLGYERHNKDRQKIWSLAESRISRLEIGLNHCTMYVLPIPLPDDWLKDEGLHAKAQAVEARMAEELGFHIERRPGETDRWAVISDGNAQLCHVEKTHCSGCGYLHAECQCHVSAIKEDNPCNNSNAPTAGCATTDDGTAPTDATASTAENPCG